jgi:uncharacterized protein DUF6928
VEFVEGSDDVVSVWEDGSLVRSLCLSPDDGITENIGDPLPFEAPYWAGEHPAGDQYPLPFHPLWLGTARFFGFSLAGRRQPADVDAESVKLAGFQVPPANPITKEMLAEFMRTYPAHYVPFGTWREADPGREEVTPARAGERIGDRGRRHTMPSSPSARPAPGPL